MEGKFFRLNGITNLTPRLFHCLKHEAHFRERLEFEMQNLV